jgi:hypothetical protein
MRSMFKDKSIESFPEPYRPRSKSGSLIKRHYKSARHPKIEYTLTENVSNLRRAQQSLHTAVCHAKH